ncbi:MAG TPA: hypothetical protein VLC46_09945 [Thermoanaerobaculia bacterium]|nr:hypothetical protein [Thermoanaerobaculia bacterium]
MVAASLTWFELDRTFRVPPSTTKKIALYALWWGFVLLNGALALFLYTQVYDLTLFANWPEWLRGVVVGGTYLSVVRQKFFTTQRSGKDDKTPIGIELLYENVKEAVFRRINDIAGAARQREVRQLSDSSQLAALARDAKLRVNNDTLLSRQRKTELLAWILTVLKDPQASEPDKKDALATFVLYGDQT